MPIWLKIYLIGCVLAIAYGVHVLRDEKNRAGIGEILFSIGIGICSWIGLFALWLGQNIHNADDGEEE